jgi:hypothetical protein
MFSRSDDIAAPTNQAKISRRDSTKGERSTALIEKMLNSKNHRELFILQREMLDLNDLSPIERARWTPKDTATYENAFEAIRYPGVVHFLQRGLRHPAGRHMFAMLVGTSVALLAICCSYYVVKAVSSNPHSGIEYVCVSAASLLAILSEILRVRLESAHEKFAISRHSTFVLDDDSVGKNSVELVDVERRPVVSPKASTDDEDKMTTTTNPMTRMTELNQNA